jgi:hypothetical protein
VNQFQLFYPSSGAWYQRRPLDEAMVLHYSDAYTTYGPFGTGSEPLRFFTLRSSASTLTGFMPSARDQLMPGQRRHVVAGFELQRNSDCVVGNERTRVVVPAQEDGLEAVVAYLGPEERLDVRSDWDHGGQYICVLAGTLGGDGECFGPFALGFSKAEDDAPELWAGETGGVVLVLRFPIDPHRPSTTASIASPEGLDE